MNALDALLAECLARGLDVRLDREVLAGRPVAWLRDSNDDLIHLTVDGERVAMDLTLEVVVRFDPSEPERALRLHRVAEPVLAGAGFVEVPDEREEVVRDQESWVMTTWVRQADTPAACAAALLAIREVDLAQYPDGDEWM
jgi:hypothetical protein